MVGSERQSAGASVLGGSVPMTRNSLRARVRWAGEKPLSSLGHDQPLRLRFSMEDTWLCLCNKTKSALFIAQGSAI